MSAWCLRSDSAVATTSSRQLGRSWKSPLGHAAAFTQGLLDDDLAAASPLILGTAARLLAATALNVFPNNVLTGPTTADSRDAHPGTVRRATAFIDDNAHLDISIADIAAAAFVTPRAVQLAFRRHLNMTPLEYLRRVRLDRAHQNLLAADPARETVTAIAYRWGFPSTSRFAATYRQTYGIVPSRTLHDKPPPGPPRPTRRFSLPWSSAKRYELRRGH